MAFGCRPAYGHPLASGRWPPTFQKASGLLPASGLLLVCGRKPTLALASLLATYWPMAVCQPLATHWPIAVGPPVASGHLLASSRLSTTGQHTWATYWLMAVGQPMVTYGPVAVDQPLASGLWPPTGRWSSSGQ